MRKAQKSLVLLSHLWIFGGNWLYIHLYWNRKPLERYTLQETVNSGYHWETFIFYFAFSFFMPCFSVHKIVHQIFIVQPLYLRLSFIFIKPETSLFIIHLQFLSLKAFVSYNFYISWLFISNWCQLCWIVIL